MQNPNPRTFAQLTEILDERNRQHGIRPLADVLPTLSAPQIVSRVPNSAMLGFCPRREAGVHNED